MLVQTDPWPLDTNSTQGMNSSQNWPSDSAHGGIVVRKRIVGSDAILPSDLLGAIGNNFMLPNVPRQPDDTLPQALFRRAMIISYRKSLNEPVILVLSFRVLRDPGAARRLTWNDMMTCLAKILKASVGDERIFGFWATCYSVLDGDFFRFTVNPPSRSLIS